MSFWCYGASSAWQALPRVQTTWYCPPPTRYTRYPLTNWCLMVFLDFLPFTCRACGNVFCAEHKELLSHGCSIKFDVRCNYTSGSKCISSIYLLLISLSLFRSDFNHPAHFAAKLSSWKKVRIQTMLYVTYILCLMSASDVQDRQILGKFAHRSRMPSGGERAE